MASAGSAQIEADAGKSLKLAGTDIPDYAAINGILIGAVIAFGIVVVFLGPEADGSHFEKAKVAIERGGGEVAPTELFENNTDVHRQFLDKPELSHIEKSEVQHKEGNGLNIWRV